MGIIKQTPILDQVRPFWWGWICKAQLAFLPNIRNCMSSSNPFLPFPLLGTPDLLRKTTTTMGRLGVACLPTTTTSQNYWHIRCHVAIQCVCRNFRPIDICQSCTCSSNDAISLELGNGKSNYRRQRCRICQIEQMNFDNHTTLCEVVSLSDACQSQISYPQTEYANLPSQWRYFSFQLSQTESHSYDEMDQSSDDPDGLESSHG